MSEWKNIEKELPKRTGEYLVTIYTYSQWNGKKERVIRTALYDASKNEWFVRQNKVRVFNEKEDVWQWVDCWRGLENIIDKPIAWMSLPEIYGGV